MDELIVVDVFVEDRAHEEFLLPLLNHLAGEYHKAIRPRVRSARGGHGRALGELELYQAAVIDRVAGLTMPDAVIIGIDANCEPFHQARRSIHSRLRPEFRDRSLIACPAPHIERWFLADMEAFARVVGSRPRVRKGKCQRDYYKALLAQAVVDGGHVPTLGGIEFAREIIAAMDLYRAARADSSLKAFLDELMGFFQRASNEREPPRERTAHP